MFCPKHTVMKTQLLEYGIPIYIIYIYYVSYSLSLFKTKINDLRFAQCTLPAHSDLPKSSVNQSIRSIFLSNNNNSKISINVNTKHTYVMKWYDMNIIFKLCIIMYEVRRTYVYHDERICTIWTNLCICNNRIHLKHFHKVNRELSIRALDVNNKNKMNEIYIIIMRLYLYVR